jgi:hypothetical protein
MIILTMCKWSMEQTKPIDENECWHKGQQDYWLEAYPEITNQQNPLSDIMNQGR